MIGIGPHQPIDTIDQMKAAIIPTNPTIYNTETQVGIWPVVISF